MASDPSLKKYLPSLTCATKFFAGVYFCGLVIFFVLRRLTFAIRTAGFSCWELIFAMIRKYPIPRHAGHLALIIFSFLSGTCNGNTYF